MTLSSFYQPEELEEMGLLIYGRDVKISRMAQIYGAQRIAVGNSVRIDDFVVLTSGSDGEVRIGNHVHIAAHAALFGGGGIILEDFTSLSGRVSVYSATDGYGGEALTNPTVPSQYTSVLKAPVVLRRHSLVGAASVLLPGVTLDEGCAVGAMSLVNRDLASWGLYVGVPARRIRDRSQALLEMERGLLEDEARGINLG